MPNVFTFYCHGSGGHRGKDDTEIVNFFGHGAKGVEGTDFLMLDGVGGKGDAAPMAGSFEFDQNSPTMKKVKDIKSVKDLMLRSSTLANIAGHGITANIDYAIAVLLQLPALPKVVNLIGWSRGAVTCLMLANRMIATFGAGVFEFNIFAVDPVAGKDAGLDPKKETNRQIPADVKNYIGILATGENRSTFAPQDADRVDAATTTSNVVFLPFPGKHSTVAKNNDAKAKEVSDIIWSIAYLFLDKFGSKTKKPSPLIMDDRTFLGEYTRILIKLDEYVKIKQKGAKQWFIGGMSFVARDFTSKLDEYVVNPEYFINQHHRKLFKAQYPNLFQYLFSSKGSTIKKTDVEKELATVDAETLESLGMLGVGGGGKGQPFVLPDGGMNFEKKRADKIKYRGSLNTMGALQAADTNKNDV